jgi:hypothetical protein
MSTSTHPGRPYVIGVIVASLLLSLASILLTNLASGPQQLGQQAIRLLLEIGLYFYLYQGRNWARWVAGSFLGLAGLLGVIGGVALLSQSPFALLLILQAAIFFSCMAVLFFMPSVRAYFTQPHGAVMPDA